MRKIVKLKILRKPTISKIVVLTRKKKKISRYCFFMFMERIRVFKRFFTSRTAKIHIK